MKRLLEDVAAQLRAGNEAIVAELEKIRAKLVTSDHFAWVFDLNEPLKALHRDQSRQIPAFPRLLRRLRAAARFDRRSTLSPPLAHVLP